MKRAAIAMIASGGEFALMLAIARVNRVFGAKPGGLIVDYLGIGAELRAALAQYSARDREQVSLNMDEAVRQLLSKVEIRFGLAGQGQLGSFLRR